MKVKSNAGFTLIELLIALAIFGLLTINIAMVSRTGTRATESGMFRQLLNSELDMTLDRIKLNLMSAAADNVYPTIPAPLGEDHIDYSTSVGVNNGRLILGAPERIRWLASSEDRGRVMWTQGMGQPDEREIQWTSNVPILQEREVVDLADNNQNGLNDEPGLSFHVQREEDESMQIFITLTVSKTDSSGKEIPVSRQVNITCRN